MAQFAPVYQKVCEMVKSRDGTGGRRCSKSYAHRPPTRLADAHNKDSEVCSATKAEQLVCCTCCWVCPF